MNDKPMPRLPKWMDEDMALVFSPSELQAIADAMLIYGLIVDGDIDTALDLCDTSDDGGYCKWQAEVMDGVRAKIDKANAPRHRKVREWIDQMREWKS